MTRESKIYAEQVQEPISLIIPAYNEAERIGRVLESALRVPLITRIVVVDDGSRDGTSAVVSDWQRRDARIRLIRHKRNRGKAAAIALGGQQIEGDIVLLLDADLSGLQPRHILQLLAPVRRRECLMSTGIFQGGRRSTDLTHRYLPFLSGQRCLRWSLFKKLLSSPDAGWSLETALNLHAWYHGYPIKRVAWRGVTHAMRPEKQPGLSGYVSHVTMWAHILRYTWRFVERTGFGSVASRLQESVAAASAPEVAIPRHDRAQLMRRPLL